MARKEESGEEKSAPAGKKRMVVVIGAAIVTSVALTAGVVAYVMNGHQGEAAAEPSGTKTEQAARKSPPVIYAIEPFVVNISDGRDMRYLKIKIEFETSAGAEAKAELDPYLSPLRDAILVLLTSKTLQEVQDLPGKSRLREEIFATASRILPPGKISRVYFTDFVVQ